MSLIMASWSTSDDSCIACELPPAMLGYNKDHLFVRHSGSDSATNLVIMDLTHHSSLFGPLRLVQLLCFNFSFRVN